MTRDIVSFAVDADRAGQFRLQPGAVRRPAHPRNRRTPILFDGHDPVDDDEVEFLIKKYPGGKFSAMLDGQIQAGDGSRSQAPTGRSPSRKELLPVVCIGGGAGMGRSSRCCGT